nr:MAG TPA: hypothetical protein [Caudoviricetes sp.]
MFSLILSCSFLIDFSYLFPYSLITGPCQG